MELSYILKVRRELFSIGKAESVLERLQMTVKVWSEEKGDCCLYAFG